jgi:hypothetical protein
VLTRAYKDELIQVTVLAEGFECEAPISILECDRHREDRNAMEWNRVF